MATYAQKLLFKAARSGRAEQFAEAMRQGCDVNLRNKAGKAALMFAAEHGNVEVLSIMIEAGVEVDAKDATMVGAEDGVKPCGETALILAAMHGQAGCVAMLIKAGADVGADGEAASAFAIRNGHASCLSLLIEGGADMDSKGFKEAARWAEEGAWRGGGHADCFHLISSKLERRGLGGQIPSKAASRKRPSL